MISTIVNLDISIFVYGGLFLFLAVGIITKRKPKNIQDYALGNQPFSIPVLIATMASTLIGGGSTIGEVSLYYSEGLLLVLPGVIGYLGYILFVHYILPKLDKYYGQISIASVLSKIYGVSVERFAGIVAYMYCFGVLVLQVKVIGIIIQYALGYNSIFATTLSFLIITIYSAWGGIRAITRTGVVQFIIFIIVLPTIGSFLLKENGGLYSLFKKVPWEKSNNFSGINYISLFIFGLTPNISPTFIHRLLVGRNNNDNKITIYFTALIQLLCSLFAIIVAAVSIVKYPGFDGNIVFFKTILGSVHNNLEQGLFAVAMLAVVLSTADSFLNTGAIIFVENVLKDKMKENNKLLILKIVTILSGFLALFISLKVKSVLEIIWFVAQYYFAIMFVPFVGGLFVKSPKPLMFWASVVTGFISYTVLKIFFPEIRYVVYVMSLFMSFLAFIITKSLFQDDVINNIKSLNSVERYIEKIIKEMNIPVSKLGYAIIPISIFTLIIEVLSNSISVNTTIFKLLAGLISISFIFIDRIFSKYNQILRNYYILFSIWYCFPFLSSYLYYALPNTNIAFANMVISCTFLAIIFSSRVLVIFMTTGTTLASIIYLMLQPTGLETFFIQLLISSSIVLYMWVISRFILREKEEGIKKFIHELTTPISGNTQETSKILNQYSNVIMILKKHEKAKRIFLEKRVGFNGYTEPKEINNINIEYLVEILKDYLSLTELEKEIKYKISNVLKNIVINQPIEMIYTVIFSVSFYMGYFNEKIIKISFINRNNQLLIKYTLPNLKFNMKEIIKYIPISDSEEGIVKFNLVETLVQNDQSMKIQINHNSITLKISLITTVIKDEEFVNITSTNKKYKFLN